MGHSREFEEQRRQMEMLRSHVERCLQDIWGVHDLVIDDDGDYPYRHGTAMCWVSPFDGPVPEVRVFTHAAQHCETFFAWYNLEHRHSGIGLHTPFDVHHVHAEAVRDKRQIVLDGAYQLHPERFVRKPPTPPAPPT